MITSFTTQNMAMTVPWCFISIIILFGNGSQCAIRLLSDGSLNIAKLCNGNLYLLLPSKHILKCSLPCKNLKLEENYLSKYPFSLFHLPIVATAATVHRRNAKKKQHRWARSFFEARLLAFFFSYCGIPFLRAEEAFWARSGNGCREFSTDLLWLYLGW